MSFGTTAIMFGETPLIHYYGIILVVGVMMAGYLAAIQAQRRRIDPNLVWDGLLWALIFGVIGARLWHVFTPMASMQAAGFSTMDYLSNPLKLINIRNGGLGIPGAVLGGVLGLWLFSLGIRPKSATDEKGWLNDNALLWVFFTALILGVLGYYLGSLQNQLQWWGALGGAILGIVLGLILSAQGLRFANTHDKLAGKSFIVREPLTNNIGEYFSYIFGKLSYSVTHWTRQPLGTSLAVVLDLAAPALLPGQSIGRWGNFVNQELYGRPTDLPWGIYIDPQFRALNYADNSYFHPVFFYEAILTLIGCLLLLWVGRRWRNWLKAGDLFLIYLVYYPVVRIFMEMLRIDSNMIGNLNTNQLIMLVVAIGALVALLYRHRRQRAVYTSN